MKILSHRGYWNDQIIQNSEEAIRISLQKGFGFESDVRDYCEQLVISHNIAEPRSINLEVVLKMLNEYNDSYCFAINIKADGLDDLLIKKLEKYNINNYFAFDMSVPQMLLYKHKNINYFTRQSEYEVEPFLYSSARGVWIDSFVDESWITKEIIQNHINNGKQVCLVSPELHKRSHLKFWELLKEMNFNTDDIMLCTDYPSEASEFFKLL